MFSRTPRTEESPKAGFLVSRDRGQVLDYLQRDPQLNLQLLDLIDRSSDASTGGEVEPVVLVAWDEDEVVGVASLRPSLLFDAHLEPPALEAFLPFFSAIETGLLKSLDTVVDDLWRYDYSSASWTELTTATVGESCLRRGGSIETCNDMCF